jgi:hypothetical protein
MSKLDECKELFRLSRLSRELEARAKVALANWLLEKTEDNFREAELATAELGLVAEELKEKLDLWEVKYG